MTLTRDRGVQNLRRISASRRANPAERLVTVSSIFLYLNKNRQALTFEPPSPGYAQRLRTLVPGTCLCVTGVRPFGLFRDCESRQSR